MTTKPTEREIQRKKLEELNLIKKKEESKNNNTVVQTLVTTSTSSKETELLTKAYKFLLEN